MWQDDGLIWNKPEKKKESTNGPHIDYSHNLRACLTFMRNVENYIHSAIQIKLTGPVGFENSLLTISWKAPKFVYGHIFATPIFLHMPREEFSKTMERSFNWHMKMAKSQDLCDGT